MKREPGWISKSLVLAIHDRLQIEHAGLSGFRDEGLLDSALVSPKNHDHFGEKDIITLAANYAHAISRNHPFTDGNKRVAFVVAVSFLELNGFLFAAPESEAHAMTLGLAAREVTEAEYAEWLKANSKRRREKER